MEWQIFALLQMALITIGVSVAFALHNRKLNSQNQQLRAHLEAVPEPLEAVIPSGEELINQALAKIAADDPCRELIDAVLHNALDPQDDFSATLRALVENSTLNAAAETDSADVEALHTRIAELEVQLAANADSPTEPAADNAAEAEELKTLLQQFTHDSREMMACIQELERENVQLREKLLDAGIDPEVFRPSPDDGEAQAVVDDPDDHDAELEAEEPQVIGGPPPEDPPGDTLESAAETVSEGEPVSEGASVSEDDPASEGEPVSEDDAASEQQPVSAEAPDDQPDTDDDATRSKQTATDDAA